MRFSPFHVSINFSGLKGVCYIRTTRPETAVIYNSNEDFHVGQAKVKLSLNHHSIKNIFKSEMRY